MSAPEPKFDPNGTLGDTEGLPWWVFAVIVCLIISGTFLVLGILT